ncbi:MAG: tectonin domain-containing protein [Bacteroidota bacterium]
MPLRNNKLFYLILLLTLGSFTHAQEFKKVGGQATDIAINPKTGKVFVVAGKNIFTDYDSSAKRWKTFSTRPNNAKSVAVTKDGVVYITSTAGEVFIEVKGKWIKVPGMKTDEVIASKDGRIYAIDTNKDLRQLYNGKWNQLSGQNKITNGLNQVIGIGPKELYARAGDNSFTKFSGGKWNTLNGKPNKIALDHKTGIIYAVGRNKGIYKWENRTNKWILLPGTRKDFVDVAVHNGKIWAVASNKSIYYYDPNKKTADYQGTYRFTFTRVLVFAVEQAMLQKSVDFFGSFGVYANGLTNTKTKSINPLDGAQNTVWKQSKLKATNVHAMFWKTKKYAPFYGHNSTLDRTSQSRYTGEFELGRIREFEVKGETANSNLWFDLQANIKMKTLTYDVVFEWQRLKLPVDKLPMNKEIFFRVEAPRPALNHFFIGFKVNKK